MVLNNSGKLVECPMYECNHCKEGYCEKENINFKGKICIDNTLYLNEISSLKKDIYIQVKSIEKKKEESLKNFPKDEKLQEKFNQVIFSLAGVINHLSELTESE